MNKTLITLFAAFAIVALISGGAGAGTVNQKDVNFITGKDVSRGTDANTVGWGSAGIIEQADYDFITRDSSNIPRTYASSKTAPVGTVEGSDYDFITKSGAENCNAILVGLIGGTCKTPS